MQIFSLIVLILEDIILSSESLVTSLRINTSSEDAGCVVYVNTLKSSTAKRIIVSSYSV